MKICADSNIILAKEAFASLGEVVLAEGRDITHKSLEDIDVLVVRSVTQVNSDLLEGTPVRFVASATIGTDHIDLAYLRDNSIGFAHAPGSNANSVAEYVVSALLHLAEKKQRRLSEMTIGIVGVGNVGSRVYALAQALGMKCLLCDPPMKERTKSDLYLPLPRVLAESDIVTMHVPLTETGAGATYKMADNDFFPAMKKHAFFINTSRGDVVDENSLRQARSKLGAVVLDVWAGEPKPHAGTIAAADIATPHIAGYSWDGKIAGTAMVHNAMAAYFFAGAEKTWRPPGAAEEQLPIVLDKKQDEDVVFAAVKAAYPIMDEDRRFRKILDKDPDKKGAFFDELRRTCPKRLEFRNFTVSLTRKYPQQIVSELTGLGFKVT
jgi:erythronate-4-phosphate dehydrogenase